MHRRFIRAARRHTTGTEHERMLTDMPKEIHLAGGCFWGLEKYLSEIRGVLATEVGYANGTGTHPSYEEVCAGDAGFAETVRATYDPALAPLPFLLELYYQVIDPTSVNRQGNDRGIQYRTGVYYTDPDDREVIQASLDRLAERYDVPLAVEFEPLRGFYRAEEYHQGYLDRNPGGYCHIGPDKFALARNSVCAAAAPRRERPDEEVIRARLTDEQYAVTQRGATEPPFRNAHWDRFEPGIYVDVVTGEPLFLSSEKFESGCGWPSFARPVFPDALEERFDGSHGMKRTEVRSRIGNSHLGHVFDDGPPRRGGLRYCVNSAALRFVPRDRMADEGYGDYLSMIDD